MLGNWIVMNGDWCGYKINVETHVIERVSDGYRPIESINAEGYVTITLNGRKYLKHRIIATVLLDNPDNLPEVDHIDGIRWNNTLDNLRWVSRTDNCRNRHRSTLPRREYVNVDENRLIPIRVTTEIALPANTYFYTNEHDAIVKRGKRGKWFILSIHERGGIDRLNLRDNGGKNHMVQLNHIRH